jgi:hypothetical protein
MMCVYRLIQYYQLKLLEMFKIQISQQTFYNSESYFPMLTNVYDSLLYSMKGNILKS